jgi:hypothetical protein
MMSEVEKVRDDKGRFKAGVSGNAKGRPKGTTGNKQRAAKASLENLLMKEGPDALRKIKEIADKALLSGELNQAMKCYVFISEKYYQLVIHNDRVEIQQIKDEQARALKQQQQEAEDTEDESTYQNVVVSFSAM